MAVKKRNAYITKSMAEYNAICGLCATLGIVVDTVTPAKDEKDWKDFPVLSIDTTGHVASHVDVVPGHVECSLDKLIKDAQTYRDLHIRISDRYVAKVNGDGSVDVGCQHIPFDVLESVYNKAKDLKNK